MLVPAPRGCVCEGTSPRQSRAHRAPPGEKSLCSLPLSTSSSSDILWTGGVSNTSLGIQHKWGSAESRAKNGENWKKFHRFWPPQGDAKAVSCGAWPREASAPSHTRLPLPRRPLGEMLIVRHESNYRHQSRSPRGDGAEFREGIATGEKAGGDGEQGGRMGRVGKARRGRERLARGKPTFALSSPEPSTLPPEA